MSRADMTDVRSKCLKQLVPRGSQTNITVWGSFTRQLNKVTSTKSGVFLCYLIDIIGLNYLNCHGKLFRPETASYQFSPGVGYQPKIRDAGGSVVVTDIKTALEAIEIIVDQGEGNPGPYADLDQLELDHFATFLKLQQGADTWDVYPVRSNPTTSGYFYEDIQIYHVRLTQMFRASC
jgi:hypothetical protein